MKKLMLIGLAALGLALLAAPSEAGLLHRNRDCGGSPACDVPCANVVWEEREVTAYRVETKSRTVEREVRTPVTREVEVPYTWYETVSVTTPEKRKVQYCETQTHEVPYTYKVSVPVVTPEKRKVTTYRTETHEVPYTYKVCVPVVKPEKRMVTTWTCVTEQVPCQVAVCRPVTYTVVDPCTGCCHTVCCKVTEMQTVMKSVVRSVPSQQEVTVNVCHYEEQERKGTRTVCETVPVPGEVTVNVCRYEEQERKGTRLVCENVIKTREIEVNVVSCKQVEHKGTRKQLVCEWETKKMPFVETYCVTVPYQTKVRVAVAVAAPCAPVEMCATPCETGRRHRLCGK